MGMFMEFVNKYMLYEVLLAIWLQFAWITYLNLRQRKVEKQSVDLPEALEGLMTKEVYDRSRLYALDHGTFGMFQNIYKRIFSTVFLLSYALYHFWNWSVYISAFMGISPSNEVLISGICAFIMQTVNEIVELPLQIYSVFILETKYGFNKQSPLFFIRDRVLKFFVMQALSVPIVCVIIWITKNGGDYFFVYLWMFSVLMMLVLMILYPEVIAPLFDKYSPLPEGELKDKINELAASLNFPLYKIFIVENSKRSSHSNAYLYGFHKYKRIVLFDTLCKEYYKPDEKDTDKDKGCDTAEILGVISHELGHWKHSHTVKLFCLSQVLLLTIFVSFVKLLHYTPMYVAFGFTDSQPIYIGITIITMYIFLPLNELFEFGAVCISRKYEFQADKFATRLGHGEALKSGLIKLLKDNLSFPLYDKLYSNWYNNHPPLIERLEAISKNM